jgi:hypothetical protein
LPTSRSIFEISEAAQNELSLLTERNVSAATDCLIYSFA